MLHIPVNLITIMLNGFAYLASYRALIYSMPLLVAVSSPLIATAEEDGQHLEAIMQELKNLDLAELREVEVSLDETFDVFDGLLANQKVSIATGEQRFAHRAPAVTTVITAQDIEAMGARDVDEVLETVPGLHVSKNGTRYGSIYVIRGLDAAPAALVLINGISIKSLFSGENIPISVWGSMPINMISRIEIIRGPGSAVYGADAVAGVINIITKTADEIDGTEVGGRVGRFNTQEAWLLHGGQVGGIDVAFSFEYDNTDGHDGIIDADAQSGFDSVFGTDASLAPGPVNLRLHSIDTRLDVSKQHWRLRLGYQERRDAGTGAGLAFTLDPVGSEDADRFNADLIYHNPHLTRYWDFTTRLSYGRQTFRPRNYNRLYPPGAFGGLYPEGFIGSPGLSESNTYFDVFGFYSGFKRHVIRVGAGYHYGDLYKIQDLRNFGDAPLGAVLDVSDTPLAYQPEGDRKDWYVSLQDTWRINAQWGLTAGVRYDHYSDFGSTVNPRFALVWDTTATLTTKFLYGQAFRAPALLELYSSNNPVKLGNPNLGPEEIETYELAFDYRVIPTLNLALNLFHYDYTDTLVPVSNEVGAEVIQNAGNQRGQGFEFEARWKSSHKSSVMFNYAYQDSDSERYTVMAPQQQAYLRTDWLLIPNWYLNARLHWVANRPRAVWDLREKIDDYTTVDLTLRYKDVRQGRINFAVGIRNLFDEDIREPGPSPALGETALIPNDMPMAGRDYFIEFRYRF